MNKHRHPDDGFRKQPGRRTVARPFDARPTARARDGKTDDPRRGAASRTLLGAVLALGLLAPCASFASEIYAVALPETVARSEQILIVEVLEPVDSASACEVNYGFKYRVERVLLGTAPEATEGLYLTSYPRGDVTSEQCPVSYSFDAYFGDVRAPFEQGQRLILFFGERVPAHAFESADRVAEVERLVGDRAPVPAQPAVEGGAAVGSAPGPTTTTATGTTTGPTVLESEGRAVLAGDTELVFVSDDPGTAVIGGAASIAAGTRPGAAQPGEGTVACRTPCRMRVPNGSYLFRVGRYEFSLAATGGLQTWEVQEANEAALAAGENLVYDGIGSLVGGSILIAAELGRDGGSETGVQAVIGYSILAIGAASILIGAPLWALCGGSAELVSGGDPGGSTAFALVPGPVAYDPWTGRAAWGLTLALTL